MSLDRAKALKAAQKYLAKGQLDKAIAEFEDIVEADPKDARSALKLGDLYTKKGDTKRASATYHAVAAQYALEGMLLKAVAVYKQILKVDPSQTEAWEQLAEMYERLSLHSDALGTYEQLATAEIRAGNDARAIQLLEKVTELDPANVSAWVRYAETLSRSGESERAVEAFGHAADLLKTRGRTDDFVKVTERLLYHKPGDHARAREVAAIYVDRGEAAQALGRLEPCFKADPGDLQTLELLARTFLLIGQHHKSIAIYKEMARAHEEDGRPAAQGWALRRVLEVDPNDAEALEGLAALGDAGAASERPSRIDEPYEDMIVIEEPSLVPGASSTRPPAPGATPLEEDTKAVVERLLSECDVFMRYGLRDKVIEQLERILELEPGHRIAKAKLHALRGGEPEPEEEDDDVVFLDDDAGEDLAEELDSDDIAELILLDGEERADSYRPPPPAGSTELSEELREALDEIDFYLQQGLTKEARDVLEEALASDPDHPALIAKLADIEGTLAPTGASPLRATQLPSRFSRAPARVDDALQAFRDEVRSQVAVGDSATHYDLGIAYMEMGLHREAIEELELCVGSTDRRCSALTLIGLSYVSLGEMQHGIDHFREALDTSGVTEEEELDLWFEMGNAHDLLGKPNDALVWYEKVEERNSGFRDIAARIERIGGAKPASRETDEFDRMFDDIILKE